LVPGCVTLFMSAFGQARSCNRVSESAWVCLSLKPVKFHCAAFQYILMCLSSLKISSWKGKFISSCEAPSCCDNREQTQGQGQI